jgi:glycosyltransferase involved in cell wall biosynthesis
VKVLYLIWSLDQGGAEQVVLNLALGLDREKFEPVICCLNEKGRYAFRAEEAGVRVEALGKKGRIDFRFLAGLTGLIRREKIDLVHTHLFSSNFWGRIVARVTGVPVVSTEHNVDHWKKPYHFWLDRAVAGISFKVVCVSRKVEAFYLEKVPALRGKTAVIYNGIDTEFFKPRGERGTGNETRDAGHGARDKAQERLGAPRGRFLAGNVGRLVTHKRQQNFIEAVARLKNAGLDIGGILAGDGPHRAELEKQARASGLEQEIIFTGFSNDTRPLYAAMDAFVLCSDREGFPMTVLEAMAAGVPVVAADVGGVSECVEDEKTGLLIPAGDPGAIARALARLAEKPELRMRLAENALERVRSEFTVRKMAAEHEVLYTEIRIKE